MGTLFSYSIISGIMLALLYMTYKCFLSSENQPRFNRITLLAIYGISLLMPPTLMLYKSLHLRRLTQPATSTSEN